MPIKQRVNRARFLLLAITLWPTNARPEKIDAKRLYPSSDVSPSQVTPKTQNRIIRHSKAYDPYPERGPHIDIKVTPPEKRGAAHYVLVEVYNRSKIDLAIVRFDITLHNRGAMDISSTVEVLDLGHNWSLPTWLRVPGKGTIPPIDRISVSNLRVYDAEARELKLPVFSDLIKE